MRIAASEYGSLKGFFGWMVNRFMPDPQGLAPEDRPLAVLERFESESMATARTGLALGLSDLLEDTADLPADQVREADVALVAEGLPSLSQVRAMFGREVGAILRRGKVRNEREYYTLRNAAELLEEARQADAWLLLADFEERISPEKDLPNGP